KTVFVFAIGSFAPFLRDAQISLARSANIVRRKANLVCAAAHISLARKGKYRCRFRRQFLSGRARTRSPAA
ncbi:MAG: hypothetical protein J6X61_01165, partial [Clostridia bacterium]|nr:hypothetical protein [Clostridia bacterium]